MDSKLKRLQPNNPPPTKLQYTSTELLYTPTELVYISTELLYMPTEVLYIIRELLSAATELGYTRDITYSVKAVQ